MKPSWLLFIFTCLLALGCSNLVEPELGQGIDFSADGKTILLTYSTSKTDGIYEYLIEDSSLHLLKSSKNSRPVKPRYAADGRKVLYLEYPNHNYELCDLVIFDKSNQKSVKVIEGKQNVTEGIFSFDGASIYFVQAASIGKVPNGNDIYRINLAGKDEKRITNFNAYSLNIVKFINDSLILANACCGKVVDGMGVVNVNSGTFIKLNIENDPRQEVSSYYIPIDFVHTKLLYSAPYEIYLYDSTNMECKLELDQKGKGQMSSICVDTSWQRLTYTMDGKLYLYGIKTEELRRIKIGGN